MSKDPKKLPFINFATSHWCDLMRKNIGICWDRRQLSDIYKEYIESCSKLDIVHKGIKYPDWRVYSLPDISYSSCQKRCPRGSWMSSDPSSLLRVQDVYSKSCRWLDPFDLVDAVADTRKIVEDELRPLTDKICALLHCKYLLMISTQEDHDLFLPIYESIYSEVVRDPQIWGPIAKNKSYWQVVSTLHLFPKDIGLMDVGTFNSELEWFMVNYLILEKGASLDGRRR